MLAEDFGGVGKAKRLRLGLEKFGGGCFGWRGCCEWLRSNRH